MDCQYLLAQNENNRFSTLDKLSVLAQAMAYFFLKIQGNQQVYSLPNIYCIVNMLFLWEWQ